MATKRNHEEDVTGEGVKKIKSGEGEGEDMVVETRVLIDNHEAGIIIGKGGANVTSIRKESGAFLSILKNETPTKERVLVVKGTTANITKALSLIINLLIEAATQRAQTNDPSGVGPDSHPIKLLVHKFLAGSIIGKGGTIIKAIMAETEARVQLSNEPLPASSEKTVTISGSPAAATKAIQMVLDQVRDNPLRAGSSTVLYVPGAALAYGAPPNPYAAYGAPPQQMYQPQQQYGAPPQQQQYGAPPQQQQYGAPAPMGGAGVGAPMGGGQSAPGGDKTEKIVIPTVCTGSVIGKGGTIIRDIKLQSGTFISIADPEPTTPDDRVVSVTGTGQGIQTAIFLIRQRVEAYQPPGMSGGIPGMGLPGGVYQ